MASLVRSQVINDTASNYYATSRSQSPSPMRNSRRDTDSATTISRKMSAEFESFKAERRKNARTPKSGKSKLTERSKSIDDKPYPQHRSLSPEFRPFLLSTKMPEIFSEPTLYSRSSSSSRSARYSKSNNQPGSQLGSTAPSVLQEGITLSTLLNGRNDAYNGGDLNHDRTLPERYGLNLLTTVKSNATASISGYDPYRDSSLLLNSRHDGTTERSLRNSNNLYSSQESMKYTNLGYHKYSQDILFDHSKPFNIQPMTPKFLSMTAGTEFFGSDTKKSSPQRQKGDAKVDRVDNSILESSLNPNNYVTSNPIPYKHWSQSDTFGNLSTTSDADVLNDTNLTSSVQKELSNFSPPLTPKKQALSTVPEISDTESKSERKVSVPKLSLSVEKEPDSQKTKIGKPAIPIQSHSPKNRNNGNNFSIIFIILQFL
jgi:hypothetical protein